MRVPAGLLDYYTVTATAALAVFLLFRNLQGLAAELRRRAVTYRAVAAGTAVILTMQQFKVPLLLGVFGQAGGSVAVALTLGAPAAAVAAALALSIQAVALEGARLAALPLNFLLVGIIAPRTGRAVFDYLTSGRSSAFAKAAAVLAAGYVGTNAAGLAGALVLSAVAFIRPGLGVPWRLAVPAVLGSDLVVFGFLEALIAASALVLFGARATARSLPSETAESANIP